MNQTTYVINQHVRNTNRALTQYQKYSGKLFETVEVAYHELKNDKFALKQYKQRVNCDRSSINKIIAIVNHDLIMKLLDQLPPYWGSLYALTKIDGDVLLELIEAGKVHQKTTLKEIRILREELEIQSSDDLDDEEEVIETENNSSTNDAIVSAEHYPVNTLIVDQSRFTPVQYNRIKKLLDQLQKEGFEIHYLDEDKISDAA